MPKEKLSQLHRPMSHDYSGFSPLAVRFSDSSKVLSHLFVRQHLQEGSLEEGCRALFVTGLPVVHHPMQEVLETLFSAFGVVESVVLHHSQLSAILMFEKEGSTGKVLKAAAQSSVLDAPLVEPTKPHGLKGWVVAHKAKFPGNAILQKELDEWMAEYEGKEAAARAAAKASTDDGWTVVARKPGRRKTTDPENATAVGGVSKAVAEARAAKKPMKQLQNFYKHQRRDKQRSDLMSLQMKFEEDKKKVAEMKAARRFKPY